VRLEGDSVEHGGAPHVRIAKTERHRYLQLGDEVGNHFAARHVDATDQLAAAEMGKLLVQWRALMKAAVEVRGQVWGTFFAPALIVGPCQGDTRLPGASEATESRRLLALSR
jgi:hypothetical protein